MEYLGEQWKKSDGVKDVGKKKKRSKINLFLSPSSFREENDRNMSSRKVINQIENQKKVKQILFDLQANEVEGINLTRIMDEVANKHKKCEELYDLIYEKKKRLEKFKGDGKNPQERDLNSQQEREWKKKNLNKQQMNEEYNRKIRRMEESQNKIRDEISIFKSNGLNILESMLEQKEIQRKKTTTLNEDELLCEKMIELDKMLSKFMLQDIGQAFSMNGESSRVGKQKYFEAERPQRELNNLEDSRLDQILQANKNTKNTTNIYTSEEFIEISRISLQREAKSFRDSEKEANSIRK